jgi:hypothetical protein
MNVNSTTPTHNTKQITINVLFLAYGARDSSITGFVPHLKLKNCEKKIRRYRILTSEK